MATSRKRVRYTFDVHFLTTEEKDVFVQRLKQRPSAADIGRKPSSII